MKFKKLSISHDELLRLVNYDPTNGDFTARVRLGPRALLGKILGSGGNRDGYWVIGLHGTDYMAHRLAWFYMKGEWPTTRLDHEDLDKRNNRWLNIRVVTDSQNRANTKIESRNKSGRKGVYWHKPMNKYHATIKVNRIRYPLGYFNDLDDAANAYDKAAIEHFGEFALTNAMIQERSNARL